MSPNNVEVTDRNDWGTAVEGSRESWIMTWQTKRKKEEWNISYS